MIPQARQAKGGSFYKKPPSHFGLPLPRTTAAHLALQGSHSEGTQLHWQETLPLTCSHCWTQVSLHTKLTHKCVIVALSSSALIMHFKTLSYQGSIKDIRYHRSIKCTVCFLIKRKHHAASERKYACDAQDNNLILKMLAKKGMYFQCTYIWWGGGMPNSKRLVIHAIYPWRKEGQYLQTSD